MDLSLEKNLEKIKIENATLYFNDQCIFKNLNLTIQHGKKIALLGPSGVGKSSLLKLIARLDTGSKYTASITTSSNKPITELISYMAQHDCLMPWLSILDNVLIGYYLRNDKITDAIKAQALDLLKEIGLSDAIDKNTYELSHGMKQRVAIARTFMENRPIILMDEPFSALDFITRTKLQDLAVSLLKNKTVFLVTHDPLEAIRIADIIYVLSGNPATLSNPIELEGEIPRDITKQNLLKKHAELIRLLM